MTQVRVFPDEHGLGASLAGEIIEGIDASRAAGRHYVLGCPGGRSSRSTHQALAERVTGADLGHVIIAMMDDYVLPLKTAASRTAPRTPTSAAVASLARRSPRR